jgi:hypothetical protein
VSLTLPVFIRRAAELDFERVEDWYDGQQPGLGREFRDAVDAAIARIADSPLHTPIGIVVLAALCCVDSPTSCGIACSKVSSSSSLAFTASAILA